MERNGKIYIYETVERLGCISYVETIIDGDSVFDRELTKPEFEKRCGVVKKINV